MSIEDYEFTILERAERGDLPRFITDDSIAPRAVFKRMIEEGFLTGAVADPVGEMQLAEVEIAYAGRLRLAEIRAERAHQSVPARVHRASVGLFRFLIGAAAIATAVIAYLALRRQSAPPPQPSPASPAAITTPAPQPTPAPAATPAHSSPTGATTPIPTKAP